MPKAFTEVDQIVKYIRFLEDRGYKVVRPRTSSRPTKKGGK